MFTVLQNTGATTEAPNNYTGDLIWPGISGVATTATLVTAGGPFTNSTSVKPTGYSKSIAIPSFTPDYENSIYDQYIRSTGLTVDLSGSFTIDFWFRRTNQYWGDSSGNPIQIFRIGDENYSQGSLNIAVGVNMDDMENYDDQIAFYTGSWSWLGSAAIPAINTWVHFAIVRSSGTLKLYQNGVDVGLSISHSVNLTGKPIQFATSSEMSTVTGYYGEIRLRPSAIWTAGFSGSLPSDPTETIASFSGTYVNMNPDHTLQKYNDLHTAGLYTKKYWSSLAIFSVDAATGFIDTTLNPVTLTNNGTVTISNGNFVFDTNGQYISAAVATKLNLGAGNWAIEIVASVSYNSQYPNIFSTKGGGSGCYAVYWGREDSERVAFAHWDVEAAANVNTNALSANTFYKVHFMRSGNKLYAYQDGVLTKETTLADIGNVLNLNHGDGLQIGRGGWDGDDGQVYGLIKSVRIWNRAVLPQ